MKVSHINPFVRYAEIRSFTPDGAEVRPYDSRIFYLEEGEVEITLNKQKINIPSKTLMLIRGGTPYALSADGEVRMLIINFDFTQNFARISDSLAPPKAEAYKPKRLLDDGDLEDMPGFNEPFIRKNMQSFEGRIYELIDAFKTPSLFRCERTSAMVKLMLTDLAALPSHSDTENTDRVIEYIKSNFTRDITNEELGRLTGYHSYHLNRLMSKQVGMTLRQYVIALRLEKAQRYAYQFGYAHIRHLRSLRL